MNGMARALTRHKHGVPAKPLSATLTLELRAACLKTIEELDSHREYVNIDTDPVTSHSRSKYMDRARCKVDGGANKSRHVTVQTTIDASTRERSQRIGDFSTAVERRW